MIFKNNFKKLLKSHRLIEKKILRVPVDDITREKETRFA